MANTADVFFKHIPDDQTVPKYAVVYFDHLYSQFQKLEPAISDAGLKNRVREMNDKRRDGKLTWDEVYGLDLALLDHLPPEDLIRKAYDMRSKYRSIAGAKDYDAYIASKPPDLSTFQITEHNPQGGGDAPAGDAAEAGADEALVTVQALRADIRYLLGQFYLYYSLLPYREGLREELTRRARNWTFFFLGGVLVFMALPYAFPLLRFPTTCVVVLAGVIGGCVSMLQRIQSAPQEGDAIFNLAALTNGWKGISLSPLYGGIFAVLLFVLFAADVLQGAIFPDVNTPGKTITESTNNSGQSVSTTTTVQPAQTPSAAAQPPSPAPTPPPPPQKLSFKSFVTETGPTNGIAYALLVIWSFIAGFAERLVPDTLNRLVAKNQAIQGETS